VLDRRAEMRRVMEEARTAPRGWNVECHLRYVTGEVTVAAGLIRPPTAPVTGNAAYRERPGQVAQPARAVIWAVLAILCLGYALHELLLIRLPVVPIRRQVPSALRVGFPLPQVALIYGVQLGAGILTRIVSPILYVLCVALLTLGNPVLGAIVMGCFGLVRTLANMAFAAGLPTIDAAVGRARSLINLEAARRLSSAAALAVVAVIAGLRLLICLTEG